MKYLIIIFLVFCSCSTTKTKINKTTVDELRNKNQVYSIKDNSYFYFMIDSINNKYLVRTSLLDASKVIWIERLTKK